MTLVSNFIREIPLIHHNLIFLFRSATSNLIPSYIAILFLENFASAVTLFSSIAAFVDAKIEGTCFYHDEALVELAEVLLPGAAMSCSGFKLQLFNAGRYWGR